MRHFFHFSHLVAFGPLQIKSVRLCSRLSHVSVRFCMFLLRFGSLWHFLCLVTSSACCRHFVMLGAARAVRPALERARMVRFVSFPRLSPSPCSRPFASSFVCAFVSRMFPRMSVPHFFRIRCHISFSIAIVFLAWDSAFVPRIPLPKSPPHRNIRRIPRTLDVFR